MKKIKIQKNNIYNMDSLEGMRLMPDNFVDIIITSPPYSNMRNYEGISIEPEDYVNWFLPFAKEFLRILKPNGTFVLNIKENKVNKERTLYVYDLVLALKRKVGFSFIDDIIWHKIKGLINVNMKGPSDIWEHCYLFGKGTDIKWFPDGVRTQYPQSSLDRMEYSIIKRFNRKDETNNVKGGIPRKDWSPNKFGAYPKNILFIPSESGNKMHTAVFPENLVKWFLLGYSNEGDVVLDPFCGSGTSMVAAKKFNRQFIGFEIVKKYYNYASQRIRQTSVQLDIKF